MNMKTFFTVENGSNKGIDHFTVKSKAIGNRVDVSVYKPAGEFENLPVVILLHGVYGSHWAWSLKAEVHLTLQEKIDEGKLPPMLLVMPSDGLFQDGSAYLSHHTADYEKWISHEVPELIKEQYQEVSENSPFFLAGLSMGGYGALRIGAKYPEVFKAFSGLSSITFFDEFEHFVEDFDTLKEAVIKEEKVFDVISENKGKIAPFRFDCGSKDTLYGGNVSLHEQLEETKIPHEFYTYEGEHSWEYWKENIAETLQFFAKQL